jgi:hypothetical protein
MSIIDTKQVIEMSLEPVEGLVPAIVGFGVGDRIDLVWDLAKWVVPSRLPYYPPSPFRAGRRRGGYIEGGFGSGGTL